MAERGIERSSFRAGPVKGALPGVASMGVAPG